MGQRSKMPNFFFFRSLFSKIHGFLEAMDVGGLGEQSWVHWKDAPTSRSTCRHEIALAAQNAAT